jgi:uncharacterized membrane-anchored protein YjiN (DUF445 family)
MSGPPILNDKSKLTDCPLEQAPPADSPPAAPPLLPTPNWTRPDDAERRDRLNAMKRRATSLLGLAGAVFILARILEARWPWLGYVRATAEASLVGGLADWFAVTALFRHPLGIRIPHTAIVATRKDRIGRVLGNFVQNHFLSRDVIAANLKAVRPAERGARWIGTPENSRRIARQMAGGLAKTLQALPDSEVRAVVRQVVNDRVRATRLAPALGKTLAVILAGERRQELVNTAIQLAAQAVRDNGELIRRQVRAETPWWVPGPVDEKIYQRVIGAIERMLRGIAGDLNHPLRRAFDTAIKDFVNRLQNSPDLIAKAETLKEEFLKDPSVTELSDRLWEATRGAVVAYSSKTDGEEADALQAGIASFGAAVLANETLLRDLDDIMVDLVSTAVERYRTEIGDLIAGTVAGWDPEATSERFELAVGRDLQFVRINGTLVGALVGLVLYTLSQLFW